PETTHVYRVAETLVVNAENADPLRDTLDARLTLTTCHPKGSARQRLVVVAVYDGPLDGAAG
ncbi:MAG: sortase domain-bontaining protein, partial [Acidimicrobiia bacterium]